MINVLVFSQEISILDIECVRTVQMILGSEAFSANLLAIIKDNT